MAGGFLKKNIYFEENAGLRESSYKTWEFDQGSCARILGFLILPGIVIYNLMVDENVSVMRFSIIIAYRLLMNSS